MRVLFVSSLSVSIELLNNDCFYTNEYDIYLNDKFIKREKKNTFSLYDLTPNTSYTVKVNDKEIEFKTLNKRVVVFKGDSSDLQDSINSLKEDEVLVIDGKYDVVNLFLKSNIEIYLTKNALLLGEIDRNKYHILKEDEFLNGKPLGTWEGHEDDSFASIITGLGVSNCLLYGEGVIDCNAHNSDFWINHRVKRIARRPKGIFLHTCKNITLEGITVCNTPSWNQHPFYSSDINYYNVILTNPQNSPTTDGIDPESCNNVNIIGCVISVGDDCIAVKSGKIGFAKKYHTPSSNITIRNCLMKHGHAGVTLGSENSGGINNLSVSQCYFNETLRGLRIKSQRGRGSEAIIDNISFDNITMNGVSAPFVINAFYKAGNDEYDYRFDRNIKEVDDGTPFFKGFTFKNIRCLNVSYGVGFFLGLPESRINSIILENIDISYNKCASGGAMAQTHEAEEFKNIGFYCENIGVLSLKNVRFLDEPVEKYIIKNVKRIEEL